MTGANFEGEATMDWFERLTGFREGNYEETRAKLKVEAGRLKSYVNGKSYGVGELELVSLQALRHRAKSLGGFLDPVNANFDVIQSARGIRRNPAQLAAPMAPLTDDPSVGGLSTHSRPGASCASGGNQPSVAPAAPSPRTARALATASASAPMPPPRPAKVLLGDRSCPVGLARRTRLSPLPTPRRLPHISMKVGSKGGSTSTAAP
jgi:hypothetical protein